MIFHFSLFIFRFFVSFGFAEALFSSFSAYTANILKKKRFRAHRPNIKHREYRKFLYLSDTPYTLSFSSKFELLFILWSLVNQFHELVEFRRDDNLCTAVALLAQVCIVGSDRVILATSTSCESLWFNSILGL